MLFGEKNVFGIECYHEPIQNQNQWIFGRMCLWMHGEQLGDLSEPACMLDETEGHIEDTLRILDTLSDPLLCGLDPPAAFELLDRAIYRDDERSDLQIANDARRYGKFDFLTNGGESFDRTKSFIINTGDFIRLLFQDGSYELHMGDIPKSIFVSVIDSFLAWIVAERAAAG